MLTGYTMNHNMSKTLRLIIFLLFVFAFLLTAPLVVLYTAGYRFDLTHGRIVHTAVLNMTSSPRNAQVFVDDEPMSDRTPSVVDTILPGEHLVRLEKDGYLSWKTPLTFKSREARVIGPIVLFLDESPILEETLVAKTIAHHEKTNRVAYLSQESSWLEVWDININSSEKKLLMRLPFDSESAYQLTWSEQGTYLLLNQHHGSLNNLSLVKASNGLGIELPEDVQDVDDFWWDVGQDDYLYVVKDELVSRFAILSNQTTSLSFQADRIQTIDHKEVVLSTSNNKAVLSIQDGETASILTYLPLSAYEFVFAPSGLIALHDTHRNRLILIEPNNRDQPILLNEEALLWKWNTTGDALLYSSGYDVKRYLRYNHQVETLTRLSQKIDFINWYPEASVALYQSNGITTALILDGATTLSQSILSTDLFGPFWINKDGSILHLLKQDGDSWQWWSRALQE